MDEGFIQNLGNNFLQRLRLYATCSLYRTDFIDGANAPDVADTQKVHVALIASAINPTHAGRIGLYNYSRSDGSLTFASR
jgi:hypothetical protein